MRRRARKLFYINSNEGPLMAGFSGDAGFCTQVMRWLKGEIERPNPLDFLKIDDLTRQCALVVREDRSVWLLGSDLVYTRVYDEFCATGAGQEIAYGALEMGASAQRAVRVVEQRSDYAGFGVNWCSFDRPGHINLEGDE